MCSKFSLIFILIFIYFVKCFLCFHVEFRESYDAKIHEFKTETYKREMSKFFDKASYSFNGFEKLESVPVLFPIDMCVLNLEGIKYATALHINKNGVRHFAVFKMHNGTYELLSDDPTPLAISMDCQSFGTKAYVALAFNITKTIDNAMEGSPILEITGNEVRPIQFFPTPNLLSVYLHETGGDLYFLQTFRNTQAARNLVCPYFVWSGLSFNKIGVIPCSNARQLEPFAIDYENYVAVANYADSNGRTATDSKIYKFNNEIKQFEWVQDIQTNGAVDVRYFSVPVDDTRRQHFLIFGNSVNEFVDKQGGGKNLEADSVFYMYEKGQFVPYQKLSLYAVEQFLPIQNADAEKFLLLVACSNQVTKIYNLNDWKFEESQTQFTEGALGRGVSKMRIYQENDESFLVIANELMHEHETNIFRPIFKQDEHANALRQQIIDWAQVQIERLSQIDVEKLKQEVEQKLAHYQQLDIDYSDIPRANIETVTTESLVYPPMRLTANYWKALTFANHALDALEQQLKARHLRKRDLKEMEDDYDYEELNIDTLTVRGKLEANRVNGIDVAKPHFESIGAKKIVVNGKYSDNQSQGRTNDEVEVIEELSIIDWHTTGRLNNYTWDELMNDTLKRSKDVQFLKAPVNIAHLDVQNVAVAEDEISGHQLAKLVMIDKGDYVVNQDIQFAKPIIAENVIIHERLNNIHVFQNKFDALLKRSNETQVVRGPKRFELIKVLEPITIAGKLLGNHLESMSPNRAIHDELILHGDYTIKGNVTIERLLKTDDLRHTPSKRSVRHILDNGLRMNGTIENVNLNFQQPIEVNNSIVSFINAVDLHHLVRTDIDTIQLVEGEVVFKNSLEIRKGFSEVKDLNGINVELLEKELFLKHTNQTIAVPMHVGRVIAKGISANTIALNNRNLSDFLTKSTHQHINGTLKTASLTAKTLTAAHVNTNGRIFNHSLDQINEQKTKNYPHPAVFKEHDKFYGTIYVENLHINTTINDVPVQVFEQQLQLLAGNIKYVGNFKFNYDMNITNLTFHGRLNGIPAEDFGRCWLQKSGNQNFTAAQTFATVEAVKGVQLFGRLNGRWFGEFFNNTFWINRDEHIPRMKFQNPIQLQSALITRTVNDLFIPEDLLYRTSAVPQVLTAPLHINGNLHVDGEIRETEWLNGFNLMHLDRFLAGQASHTLHVQHANFVVAPRYKTLNRHNLKQTLDEVWLANENADLTNYVEIAEANFEGLVEFQGLINNWDLNYLKENYFSLSRPQTISGELNFMNETIFDGDVTTDHIILNGPIIDISSNTSFDFNQFVSNTLKTAGHHTVLGRWTIANATIHGDLRNVLINKLNLVNDVLHINSPFTEIRAPKTVKSASINKLYTLPDTRINDVNIHHWIKHTVFVYENYTIRGTTTLDAVNLTDDLRVLGTVNGIKFDEQTLLLRDRDQIITGNVAIRNMNSETQQIMANNIKKLEIENLNNVNITAFLETRARLEPNLAVEGHLVFKGPLTLQEYHTMDNSYDGSKWKRDAEAEFGRKQQQLTELQRAVEQLKRIKEASNFVFQHFEVRQTVALNATCLVPLSSNKTNGSLIDFVAICQENDTPRFYQWKSEQQKFITYEDADAPSRYETHLEAEKQRSEVLHCYALHSKVGAPVPLECCELAKVAKPYERQDIKQVVPLAADVIAILTDQAIELWSLNTIYKLLQHIPLLQPKQLSSHRRGDTLYLAVISAVKLHSLHHGAVELFKSKNASRFVHYQTLLIPHPQQLSFIKLPPSEDMLLAVLTSSPAAPLLVYQYRGVMRFEEILGTSTLPAAESMEVLTVQDGKQHFIALLGKQAITFVEILLKRR